MVWLTVSDDGVKRTQTDNNKQILRMIPFCTDREYLEDRKVETCLTNKLMPLFITDPFSYYSNRFCIRCKEINLINISPLEMLNIRAKQLLNRSNYWGVLTIFQVGDLIDYRWGDRGPGWFLWERFNPKSSKLEIALTMLNANNQAVHFYTSYDTVWTPQTRRQVKMSLYVKQTPHYVCKNSGRYVSSIDDMIRAVKDRHWITEHCADHTRCNCFDRQLNRQHVNYRGVNKVASYTAPSLKYLTLSFVKSYFFYHRDYIKEQLPKTVYDDIKQFNIL